VTYAGMLQYDGDLKLPARFLVAPPAIRDTMGEWFSKAGLAQFACSETQKFGHVTYFWNGNRSGKFAGETWQEVPSDVVPFEQRPWMKAAEIADAMIAALQSASTRPCAATSPMATWSAIPAIFGRRRWRSRPSTCNWRACCRSSTRWAAWR
jgi:hypothetical protein